MSSAYQSAGGQRACIRLHTILVCTCYMLVFLVLGSGAQQGTVRIIDMLYTKDYRFAYDVKAYKTGINASLWSRKNTVAGGMKIELIEITPDFTETAVTKAIDTALTANSDILAVLGPVGVTALQRTLPSLKKYNMVALAPLAGSSKMRQWNPHYYYLTADSMTAVHALVRYAVTILRVRRLGFMYLTGVQYGDEEYVFADSLMKGMGYAFCGVFAVTGTKEWKATDAEFQKEFEEFVATKPQAVLLFGKPSNNTAIFIKQLLKDARTSQVYILCDLYPQDMILSTWKEAVAGGVPFKEGQLISVGDNPLPTDTRYDAVVRFQKVMKDYFSSGGQKEYNNPLVFLEDQSVGELMVGGWLVGEVLSQMLASSEWIRNRKTFAESLFNQRRYRVDDILIGSFGGDCSGQASAQGAICRCNQGGRTAYFKKFLKGFRPEVDEMGEFSYPLDICHVEKVKLYSPTNVVSVFSKEYSFLFRILGDLYVGLIAALPLLKYQKHPVTIKVVTAGNLGLRRALEVERDTFITHLVSGFVSDDMLNVANITFIDPVFVEPHVSSLLENVIYISATIEQELFVLSEWLSKGGKRDANIHIAVRGSKGMEITTLLKRTLMTFGLHLHSHLLITRESPFIGLPTDGDVFLIGLRPSDIKHIYKYLMDNPEVRVLVRFYDFAALYSFFKVGKHKKQLMDRVIFATGLPHWAEKNSSSSTVHAFHAAVKDTKKWNPSTFQAFAMTRALFSASAALDVLNAYSVANAFYSRVMLNIDDLFYGPFNNGRDASCPDGVDANGRPCLRNYGATSISVWSTTRAIYPTEAVLYGPVTPSMIYAKPPTGLTKEEFAGLVIGTVFLGLLLITIIVVLIYCCRDTRGNRNAPQKLQEPVTLIFTDIQSSTALWAACPDTMPDALEAHHRLIRWLIAKYKCYEVKTVGDSFMIACKSPYAAVQLMGDLQRTFLQHDWGTSAIDEAYHEFEEAQAVDDADYKPPTARLDDAVYREHWSGLRVRAGVHTGLSDIRFDEVTKRYDYYGSTSNTAARTESVANGGQVLLTRAAYMALSTAERAGLNVTALGAVELRGVPEPVEMLQLNPVPGRTFAALRVDREFGYGLNFALSDASSLTLGEDENSDAVESFASVLRCAFSAFPASQRMKYLYPFCERWRVPVPQKTASSSDEEHCARVIRMLAKKQHRVLEKTALRSKEDLVSNRLLESITTKRGFLQSFTSSSSSKLYQGFDGSTHNFSASNYAYVQLPEYLRDMFGGY